MTTTSHRPTTVDGAGGNDSDGLIRTTLAVQGTRSRARASLLLLPALVVALSLGHVVAASAQATPFQASVSSTQTVPFSKAGGCPNGAYICGTANIAGYGAASWVLFNTIGFFGPGPCGVTYLSQDAFTLGSDPSSTLVLDESGNTCGLGNDGAAYRGGQSGGPMDFGHPFKNVGSWTVDPASTGQFLGLIGSGTDILNVAGAHVAGSFAGTLG